MTVGEAGRHWPTIWSRTFNLMPTHIKGSTHISGGVVTESEDSPGVVIGVVVVEAGDEDTEREGTETVVEEPVEDSAAVEEHERDGG